ncbi:MAG: ThiF family adenylyltransferase [Actinomycetota bacterium]
MSEALAPEPRPTVRQEVVNNLGFWTVEQQQILEQSCVAVAGLGGAGGAVVELLGRCGVRSWKLADPDTSEAANIGRQAGSSHATVGVPKVFITAAALRSVHREVEIETYPEGVTAENVEEFVSGADIVLDAIAIEAAWLSVLLGRRARAHGIPMVTSIEVGDGCQYTAFGPDASMSEGSADAFFGVDEDQPADESMVIDLDALLSYFPPSFPAGLMGALAAGRVRTPAHAMGVARNASAVARAMRELLFDPRGDHAFVYPTVVVDDPDPAVGIFPVHHRERPWRRRSSFAAVERTRGGCRFSTLDEYDIV